MTLYLYHKVLLNKMMYYKHDMNILSDYEFDMLERDLTASMPEWEEEGMVDFDPKFCDVAKELDMLSKPEALSLAEALDIRCVTAPVPTKELRVSVEWDKIPDGIYSVLIKGA